MNRLRRMAAWGLMGGAIMAMTPLGCTMKSVRIRYRAQGNGPYLPDSTIERFQGCVEDHGDELYEGPYHVEATVQVDREGRKQGVTVTGIPESATNFAACTRITLREMTVPMSSLPLRPNQAAGARNEQTVSRGNEVGNPIVLVNLAAALAEFVAQHGGRIVLYSVTVEVLGAAAVVAVGKLSKRCQRVREQCIISCGDSELPTGDYAGDPFHKCVRECMERAGCF